jgi:lipoprotein NlpI
MVQLNRGVWWWGLVVAALATAWVGACNQPSRDASLFTSAGVTHLQQGEYDRAIRDFDRAIALQPGLVVAWKNRGLAYRGKGDYERALADYDQAVLLAPTDARILNDVGVTYLAVKDYPRAIQMFDRAISLKPDHAAAIENRGRTNFLLGNFAQAAADLQRGLSLDSANASVVIWLHLARQRLRQDDAADFVSHAAAADTTHWPAPVLRYFLGALSADSLRSLPADTSADAPKDQRCTVAFYLGEAALLRGERDEAATLFGETRNACPKDGPEHMAAVAELQRLHPVGSS